MGSATGPAREANCGAFAGLGAWCPGAPLPHHPGLLSLPYEKETLINAGFTGKGGRWGIRSVT